MRKCVRVKDRLESITVSDPTTTMGDTNSTPTNDLKRLYVSYKIHPTFLYHSASLYGKFRD